jgi:starvation-inducible DNA-binding protein
MKPQIFPSRIDFTPEVRKPLVELLNQQLADTVDLWTQTKYAHWNVKGANFISLHKLFDELAGRLEEMTDEIAERATALGGVAAGTLRQAAGASRLPEFPSRTFTDLAVVEALAVRYAALAKTTREAITQADDYQDQGTADLLTGVSRELDKALWFLESHLQK